MITNCYHSALFKKLLVLLLITFAPAAAIAVNCPLSLEVGAADSAPALQSAIDDCSAHGGGTVDVKPGVWSTSPIHLKSHVTLHLLSGAKLIAVTDFAKYPITEELIWQGKPQKRPLALISAQQQVDVALTGKGVIDGHGVTWWTAYHQRKKATGEELPRPWLVQFDRCRGVRVEGLEFRDSPAYTIVAYLSDDVEVRNIRIFAPPDSPNTDGIVAYSSHHVRIEGSIVDSGDDNIAIKSSRALVPGVDTAASDILATHCVFVHGHGATIGADTGGGVHNVTISNVEFRGTTNGIRIKSAREMSGDVSNITYEDLRMKGASPVITLSEYYPRIPARDSAQPMADRTPRFHDIRILHVTADGAADAGSIVGLPESPIRNVQLSDVSIQSGQGLKIRSAEVSIKHSHLRSSTGPPLIQEQGARVQVTNNSPAPTE